jgi:hypothetical protein
MNQSVFWRELGVSTSFSQYDQGKYQISAKYFEQMHRLGLNLNWLFDDTQPMLIEQLTANSDTELKKRLTEIASLLEAVLDGNSKTIDEIKSMVEKL